MTKQEVIAGHNINELFEFMTENNTAEFNFNKALEEATEFMEAAIKHKTKSPKNPKRPTVEDVLEEYTDFSYRGFILVRSLFPNKTSEEVEAMIEAHLKKKTDALFGWLESGKYNNGL